MGLTPPPHADADTRPATRCCARAVLQQRLQPNACALVWNDKGEVCLFSRDDHCHGICKVSSMKVALQLGMRREAAEFTHVSSQCLVKFLHVHHQADLVAEAAGRRCSARAHTPQQVPVTHFVQERCMKLVMAARKMRLSPVPFLQRVVCGMPAPLCFTHGRRRGGRRHVSQGGSECASDADAGAGDNVLPVGHHVRQ
jgi:hypothetical protein